MSTSPSWFDKEKFSRLVKKVGPKSAPEPSPSPSGSESENRPAAGGQEAAQPLSFEKALQTRRPAPPVAPQEPSQASTAHISLVSKPPSLLSEHRALPALPRRTMPLPGLKALFPNSAPATRSPFANQPNPEAAPAGAPVKSFTPNEEEAVEEKEEIASPAPGGDEMAGVWQKMTQLNDELARTILERDQAVNQGALLREQLRQADETLEANEKAAAPNEELARLTQERDDALSEGKNLREQLRKNQEAPQAEPAPGQDKEISQLTEERDQARKEYAKLRDQFETLKQEHQAPKDDGGKFRSKELEQQLEGFRLKLEERNREIAVLKANPTPGSSNEAMEKLKQEITLLREQLTRAKDETSIAQRGLALSQKALHETRDTLREATEGTSLSRHNFDNLKNECATLVQQNTVLQGQNEQLLRDLSAAKSKLTTRL